MKVKEYPEKHQQGNIYIEQRLKFGVYHGDIGIQIATDGRIIKFAELAEK